MRIEEIISILDKFEDDTRDFHKLPFSRRQAISEAITMLERVEKFNDFFEKFELMKGPHSELAAKIWRIMNADEEF